MLNFFQKKKKLLLLITDVSAFEKKELGFKDWIIWNHNAIIMKLLLASGFWKQGGAGTLCGVCKDTKKKPFKIRQSLVYS